MTRYRHDTIRRSTGAQMSDVGGGGGGREDKTQIIWRVYHQIWTSPDHLSETTGRTDPETFRPISNQSNVLTRGAFGSKRSQLKTRTLLEIHRVVFTWAGKHD